MFDVLCVFEELLYDARKCVACLTFLMDLKFGDLRSFEFVPWVDDLFVPSKNCRISYNL